MPKPVKDQCPRCGRGIPNDEQRGEYPGALSRYDNETYVCSQCGQDEAMENWFAGGLLRRELWWDHTGVRP